MKGIFDCNELKQLKASPFRAYLQPITKSEVTSCGCIVYGAGQIAKELLFWLKRAGVTPICIVDRNLELSGTVVDGIAVYPPEELLNHKANVVIIIATCYIRSVLMCNPFLKGRRVVAWTAVHQICPVVPEMAESVDACIEDENVSQAYALLADESSKKLFKDIIKFHLTFDEAIFSNYDPDIYFPADLPLNHHCFIDVGAYNGDTLKRWLNHGFPKSPNDRYYAFEPNPAEFVRIQALTAKLPETTQRCVELCNMGLGAEDSTMHLSVTDVGKTSRLIDHQQPLEEKGGGQVKIVKLDDALPPVARPTFLKADVEGFELPFLEGAKKTVERCAPNLAISIYHRFSDLWRVPLWINRTKPEYTLYLRRHGWAYDDAVCYALWSK